MRLRAIIFVFIGLTLLCLQLAPVLAQATITVNSTADNSTGGDNECTLREAITNANGNSETTSGDCVAGSGTDTIEFNIAGAGPHTITVGSILPTISDPVVIDGLSQAGADCQTELMIVINGSATVGAAGIALNNAGSGSTIRGLTIQGFATLGSAHGLRLDNSDDNIIQCNFVGTNSTGTATVGNYIGIVLFNGASNNLVGTDGNSVDDANEGNLISGNNSIGFWIAQAGSTNNRFAGNLVGTDITGTVDLGSTSGDGVQISQTASNNIIGTNGDGIGDAVEGNLISGNNRHGVFLSDGDNNRVAGNLIGTDITGTLDLGNTSNGVFIQTSSLNNIIGTNGNGSSDALEGNVISGNDAVGVLIQSNSNNNTVAGNKVGTDLSGTAAIGNTSAGIAVAVTSTNTIIGTDGDGISDALEGNLVSGNRDTAIYLLNSDDTVVAGNIVGTDITGTVALGSLGFAGIQVDTNSDRARIGTNGDGVSDDLEGNLFSGNAGFGISSASTAHNLIVAGNIVGTDISGTFAIPNGNNGIDTSGNNNRIGTNGDGVSDALEGNLVSGNSGNGIEFDTTTTGSNIVAGNIVGTNLAGTAAIANSGAGILTVSANHRIGTNGDGISDALEANLISGNTSDGILLSGTSASGNSIAGNYIGLDSSGNVALANGGNGINLINGASNNTIGGALDAQSNVIGGNNAVGVSISGANSTGNVINNNYIGTNISWTNLANGTNGIDISATGTALTTVSNNWIFYHPTTGVLLSNAADLGVAGVSEQNCLYQNVTGLNNTTGVNSFFENNWWGNASGPSGVGPGTGDSVSANIDYIAFLTVAPTGCPDIVGVTINPLAVSAAEGATTSYTIVLNSAPAAGETVTITVMISVAAAGEIATTNSLTFTFDDTNWNTPQQFDVMLADDFIANGNRTYIAAFTHSSDSTNPASGYDAPATLVIDSVDLEVIDNESPNVVINPTAWSMITGDSRAYDVYLTTEPAFDVTITLTQLDANCTISTTTLTFTNSAGASPWNVPQQVTVTGVGASGRNCAIQHTPTGGGYDAVVAADVVVTLRRGNVPASPTTGDEPAIADFDPAISKLGELLPGQTGIVGEELEWVVTISNVGIVAGTNVTVTDTLILALQIDSVDAPGATVTIAGQTVTVVYPTLAIGQTVQFSIFTTVLSGMTVDNTACVNASNQGVEECASAISASFSELPATGEAPGWRYGLLVVIVFTGLILIFYLYRKPSGKT